MPPAPDWPTIQRTRAALVRVVQQQGFCLVAEEMMRDLFPDEVPDPTGLIAACFLFSNHRPPATGLELCARWCQEQQLQAHTDPIQRTTRFTPLRPRPGRACIEWVELIPLDAPPEVQYWAEERAAVGLRRLMRDEWGVEIAPSRWHQRATASELGTLLKLWVVRDEE